MVVGHEFVGEIVGIGSNVKDFFPGQVVSVDIGDQTETGDQPRSLGARFHCYAEDWRHIVAADLLHDAA
jgi:D-arabinose 1-dehydrogenase-like Zn-dependent alcohol dehydrogenase